MPSYILTAAETPTLLQRFGLRMLGLLGWTVAFKPVPGPRGVVIVYPHTSNWDFIYGLFAKWAIGVPFHWLGKPALFRPGLGWFMRAVGGEPIERENPTGAIQRLAERIQAADFYWLALTPEGTRKYKPSWRSGFYHITLAAKVPVGICALDYKAKQVRFIDYITLSGDVAADTALIQQQFEGVVGHTPQNAAPIIFDPTKKTAAAGNPGAAASGTTKA